MDINDTFYEGSIDIIHEGKKIAGFNASYPDIEGNHVVNFSFPQITLRIDDNKRMYNPCYLTYDIGKILYWVFSKDMKVNQTIINAYGIDKKEPMLNILKTSNVIKKKINDYSIIIYGLIYNDPRSNIKYIGDFHKPEKSKIFLPLIIYAKYKDNKINVIEYDDDKFDEYINKLLNFFIKEKHKPFIDKLVINFSKKTNFFTITGEKFHSSQELSIIIFSTKRGTRVKGSCVNYQISGLSLPKTGKMKTVVSISQLLGYTIKKKSEKEEKRHVFIIFSLYGNILYGKYENGKKFYHVYLVENGNLKRVDVGDYNSILNSYVEHKPIIKEIITSLGEFKLERTDTCQKTIIYEDKTTGIKYNLKRTDSEKLDEANTLIRLVGKSLLLKKPTLRFVPSGEEITDISQGNDFFSIKARVFFDEMKPELKEGEKRPRVKLGDREKLVIQAELARIDVDLIHISFNPDMLRKRITAIKKVKWYDINRIFVLPFFDKTGLPFYGLISLDLENERKKEIVGLKLPSIKKETLPKNYVNKYVKKDPESIVKYEKYYNSIINTFKQIKDKNNYGIKITDELYLDYLNWLTKFKRLLTHSKKNAETFLEIKEKERISLLKKGKEIKIKTYVLMYEEWKRKKEIKVIEKIVNVDNFLQDSNMKVGVHISKTNKELLEDYIEWLLEKNLQHSGKNVREYIVFREKQDPVNAKLIKEYDVYGKLYNEWDKKHPREKILIYDKKGKVIMDKQGNPKFILKQVDFERISKFFSSINVKKTDDEIFDFDYYIGWVDRRKRGQEHDLKLLKLYIYKYKKASIHEIMAKNLIKYGTLFEKWKESQKIPEIPKTKKKITIRDFFLEKGIKEPISIRKQVLLAYEEEIEKRKKSKTRKTTSQKKQ